MSVMVLSLSRPDSPEGRDGQPEKECTGTVTGQSSAKHPSEPCEAASGSKSATTAPSLAAGGTGLHASAPRHDYAAPLSREPSGLPVEQPRHRAADEREPLLCRAFSEHLKYQHRDAGARAAAGRTACKTLKLTEFRPRSRLAVIAIHHVTARSNCARKS